MEPHAGGAILSWRMYVQRSVNKGESEPPPALRCAHCGEAIGVYEPTVIVEAGQVRQSSRAADPELASSPEVATFHASCYWFATA